MPSQWGHLYKRAIWRRLRRAQLAEKPLCEYCERLGLIVPATVVDHVRPHKGDMGLFADPNNLQSLCAPCHDMHKQRVDMGLPLAGCDADGYPIDPNHPWFEE